MKNLATKILKFLKVYCWQTIRWLTVFLLFLVFFEAAYLFYKHVWTVEPAEPSEIAQRETRLDTAALNQILETIEVKESNFNQSLTNYKSPF